MATKEQVLSALKDLVEATEEKALELEEAIERHGGYYTNESDKEFYFAWSTAAEILQEEKK